MQNIEVIGARKHNLKNVHLKIPKRQFITICGVSGSGKSTLAYDTIFQEGQRKYLESLSAYARQYIKTLEKPDVQSIRGISPTISIDQKHSSFFYNSTVGTISELSQYLRLLFARVAVGRCPKCGKQIVQYSDQRMIQFLYDQFKGQVVQLLAPVVKNRKGNYRALLERYLKRGYLKAWVDGSMYYLDDPPDIDRYNRHDIAILIDAVEIDTASRKQVEESVSLATFEGGEEMMVLVGDNSHFLSNRFYCADCKISLREPQPASFSFNSPVGACQTCNGLGRFERGEICEPCLGSGLNENARSFYFRGKNIFELSEMEVGDLLTFFIDVESTSDEDRILRPILPQIVQRLESFVKLNLGYISLNRKVNTLSGGELQRTRLVSQIGFSLSGIIYILDEPSIGMHAAEQENLIHILDQLKAKDNTIIVVEHDEQTIRSSDFIIDMGPGAGEHGGELVFSGPIKKFAAASDSITSDYLYGRKTISYKKSYIQPRDEFLRIRGISINNIRKQTLKLPLKSLSVVTGVSGSGKSSLVIDGLYQIIRQQLDGQARLNRGISFKAVEGAEQIARIQIVDQGAIGKNSRSCPATYVGLMPLIRSLFAGLTAAKMNGYKENRFSFNVRGGRCEACAGLGYKKIEMSFLPQLRVICPVCDGDRFNSETLKVKYSGFSIADILNLTANEAHDLFADIPLLSRKLNTLIDVGLGYLRLGQGSATLSGGESQRIKLCKELSRGSGKATLYILDEPTVGLHFDDIQKLLNVFESLIVKGNTVVVIEHNLDIAAAADTVIDLGPAGGKGGGKILYQGPLKGILKNKQSVTAKYLEKRWFNGV